MDLPAALRAEEDDRLGDDDEGRTLNWKASWPRRCDPSSPVSSALALLVPAGPIRQTVREIGEPGSLDAFAVLLLGRGLSPGFRIGHAMPPARQDRSAGGLVLGAMAITVAGVGLFRSASASQRVRPVGLSATERHWSSRSPGAASAARLCACHG
jgi:hypothetical protein